MLTNEAYKPINCDDYDNLELACQKHWTLSLELKNGDQLKAKAVDMVSRKNVEYLAVDLSGETREVRLDHIASFTHPELGTVIVSEDE
ncbi:MULTISPECIES: Rho-binding antiterminator [Pantoea]|jgi:Rho-binding antiterminator|uniref:Rho-binding antiterminator n=1 Tax=Pantoea leporis TaxID=2933780 RepID=A0ABV2E0Z8_9GAMM|nr:MULTISPECIES: Rho-binding antiterminator [Pantoea]MBY4889783.1 Rho-binding antiterminator [Pantoea sp. DY-15]WFL68267.1 Rho-binding antiterminator [Pantoea sp. X85]